MVIRAAERRDVDGILELWEALQADGNAADPRYATAPGGRAAMKEAWADLWVCRDPFPGCFVADDGAFCGFVSGTLIRQNPIVSPAATVRIDNAYVAPRVRRQGVGRRLVDAFVGATEAAGFHGVDVGTLIKDERAVAFWKGLGFDPMRITLVRSADR